VAIAVVGTLLAGLADRIADETGAGESLTGGILLGAATSLGGTVTSVSTAFQGQPDLAISNAIGGIAAQTAFLALADMAYRRANLEHAAASLENLLQAALLVGMLALPLVAANLPGFTVLEVDVFSGLILGFYVFANWQIAAAKDAPMWQPEVTAATQDEAAESEAGQARPSVLLIKFALLAAIAGLGGYALGQSGLRLAAITGLSQTAVGGIMTSVVTSMPELITSIAAVRRGALNLAVGGIIGGNAFDVLFLVLSDVAYREGSIYQAFSETHRFVLAISIVMAAVLLMGLLKRERQGPAGIGFESVLILGLYGFAAWVMASAS
jgi:cation:H+ antiporter